MGFLGLEDDRLELEGVFGEVSPILDFLFRFPFEGDVLLAGSPVEAGDKVDGLGGGFRLF